MHHTHRVAGLAGWLLVTILLAGSALADDAPPAAAAPVPDASSPPFPPPYDVDTPATVRDAVSAADVGQPPLHAPPQYPTYRRRSRWDVAVEGGVSIFEDPSGIIGEPLPAGTAPLNWGANEYGSAFGVRFTIGYSTGGPNRWEVRGTYGGSWDDSSRQTGQFGFRPTPGAPLILSPAGASATLTNETDIWGGELNWWRTYSCNDCWRLSAGLGLRYLRIDDEARADNWVGLAPNSFLRGEVENGFLGAQLLGSLRMYPARKVELNVSLKVLLGAMGRDMEENDSSMVTGGPTLNAVREESSFSWGLEGEVGVFYRLAPRAGITAAYTILVLDEVGRAEAALDFSQAATGSVQLFDNADTAVLHSFFLGFRLDL